MTYLILCSLGALWALLVAFTTGYTLTSWQWWVLQIPAWIACIGVVWVQER